MQNRKRNWTANSSVKLSLYVVLDLVLSSVLMAQEYTVSVFVRSVFCYC